MNRQFFEKVLRNKNVPPTDFRMPVSYKRGIPVVSSRGDDTSVQTIADLQLGAVGVLRRRLCESGQRKLYASGFVTATELFSGIVKFRNRKLQ